MENEKKVDARDRRDAIIQILRIASYSVSLLVMLVVLFMLVTQAGILRHVSQVMDETTQSFGDTSDFGTGGGSAYDE